MLRLPPRSASEQTVHEKWWLFVPRSWLEYQERKSLVRHQSHHWRGPPTTDEVSEILMGCSWACFDGGVTCQREPKFRLWTPFQNTRTHVNRLQTASAHECSRGVFVFVLLLFSPVGFLFLLGLYCCCVFFALAVFSFCFPGSIFLLFGFCFTSLYSRGCEHIL